MKKSPVTLLLYVPQLVTGGTERNVMNLALGIDLDKFTPIVWCPGNWGHFGERLVESGITCLRWRRPSRRNPLAWVNLVLRFRHIGIGVFHSFGYGPHFADSILAKLAGSNIYISSRRNIRHWDERQKLRIGERIRNRISVAITANSKAVALRTIEVEGVDPRQIRVIPNGIDEPGQLDLEQLAAVREQYGIPAEVTLLANAGSLKAIKGQMRLLEVVAELMKEQVDVHLVIAGEGEMRDELLSASRRMGISDRVHMPGLVQDIDSLLQTADVYLHSSKAEGSPNAVIEAMANRLPVVATDVGGIGELVINSTTGFAIPDDAHIVRQMADLVMKIINDSDLARSLGENAQKRAKSRYSVTAMVRAHEQLYIQLLNRRDAL